MRNTNSPWGHVLFVTLYQHEEFTLEDIPNNIPAKLGYI
jgi:hypothetical protein